MSNNKNTTVYCDYDSVLNNMSYQWLKWLNHTYKTNYKIQDVDRWSWFSDLQKDKSNKIKPYDWFNEGIVFGGGTFEAKPLEGSIDFFNALTDLYNTFILTTSTHKEIIPQKDRHIAKYYGTESVIHEKDKWRYAVNKYNEPNTLIDDRLSNCLMFVAKGGNAILYNHNGEYEYNRLYRNMNRIFIANSYDEVMDILRVLHG